MTDAGSPSLIQRIRKGLKPVDYVIGAMLVLALLGSAIGVATWESAPGAQDLLFDASFPTYDFQFAAPDQTLASAGTKTFQVPVPVMNITSAKVTVTVKGTPPRAATKTIDISVEPPQLAKATKAGSLGSQDPSTGVVVDLALASVPQAREVRAASEAEARSEIWANTTSIVGQGQWTVTVTLGANPTDVVSETFTISVKLEGKAYSAVLAPRLPSGGNL
jgi:hypothetical protein